jgi:hypothetical protein
MSPAELAAYLLPALGIAVAVTLAVWALLRRPLGLDWRHLVTLGLCLFFLTLTQYPLPDPATLDCSGGGVAPILQPFETLVHVGRMLAWQANDPDAVTWRTWVGSKVLQAAAMNLLLCAAIGAALARHRRVGWRGAMAFAVALSGGAELAQLTGLFGLYPCAFRTFEVDDLILNIGGLMVGFGLMRRYAPAVSP